VTLQGDAEGTEEMEDGIRETVAERIGKFARPKRIIWADDLPKTRSGKIMRRLLRDIAEGRALGRRDDAARSERGRAARPGGRRLGRGLAEPDGPGAPCIGSPRPSALHLRARRAPPRRCERSRIGSGTPTT
jgi:hypothetical protein